MAMEMAMEPGKDSLQYLAMAIESVVTMAMESDSQRGPIVPWLGSRQTMSMEPG